MILADWDLAAGRLRGAGVVSIGAASASILADAGAHIDCERFVRPSVAMVATLLKFQRRLPARRAVERADEDLLHRIISLVLF